VIRPGVNTLSTFVDGANVKIISVFSDTNVTVLSTAVSYSGTTISSIPAYDGTNILYQYGKISDHGQIQTIFSN